MKKLGIVKKILIVFGTRPEIIKMAPIIHVFKQHPNLFQIKTCVTAQHRQMLDQMLELFEITADYDLDVMSNNQSLFELTSVILNNMPNILEEYAPDLVLVQGDTTTAFTVALSAFYKKIAVGHIEAGLRTYDLYSPWPEEGNRRFISEIATYHFAPTLLSYKNLLSEKIKQNVYITGNTVVDALSWVRKKIEQDESIKEKIIINIENQAFPLSQNIANCKKYVLITAHRRESHGYGFQQICAAIKTLAKQNSNVDWVYPVHLNPQVREVVYNELANIDNVYLLNPLGYADLIFLMSHCFLILTDSGGLQEEAPSFAKPVLVMRTTTERVEAIDAGTSILVGTESNSIVNAVNQLIQNPQQYNKMCLSKNPFGDGNSAINIFNILLENLFEDRTQSPFINLETEVF